MYTSLSPCDMCTGACILYKVKRVVIGENKTFVGGEEHLKSKGIEVVVFDNGECKDLMGKFIEEKPHVWYVLAPVINSFHDEHCMEFLVAKQHGSVGMRILVSRDNMVIETFLYFLSTVLEPPFAFLLCQSVNFFEEELEIIRVDAWCDTVAKIDYPSFLSTTKAFDHILGDSSDRFMAAV